MNIIQIYQRFPKEADCLKHLENARWHGKPICPYCKSDRVTAAPKEQRFHCNNCKTSFSVTVGTIFHKTHLDLQKWFLAVVLMLNAKKGISARQLARDLEVNKNTAWSLAMRIRRAMLEQMELLEGIVEMDETFVGGKPRKGGPPSKRGRGTKKIPVVGMIERGGRVVAEPAKKLSQKHLMKLIRRNMNVDNTILMTDQYSGYFPAGNIVASHKSVDHSFQYANGTIHTNNIESFWALLKRGIVGQYHKVSAKHLQKYITEFSYRHNNRDVDGIFELTLARAVGVR
jgi:transposase-like protein